MASKGPKSPMTKSVVAKPRKASTKATPAVVPFVDEAPVPAPVLEPTMAAAAAIAVEPLTTVSAPAEPALQTAPAVAAAAHSKETEMTDTINQTEDTVKTETAALGEKATEIFHDVQSRAKAAFEKSGETMKDVAEYHKANLEALVESGKIAAKGAQTAAQNAAEFGRKNWEATTSFAKTAATVKAPTELFKLQGEFMRSQFDAAVAEFSRSTEFNLKLAGEIVQPIQNRFAATGEMLKTRLAA